VGAGVVAPSSRTPPSVGVGFGVGVGVAVDVDSGVGVRVPLSPSPPSSAAAAVAVSSFPKTSVSIVSRYVSGSRGTATVPVGRSNRAETSIRSAVT
jgi:hypothetical protein